MGFASGSQYAQETWDIARDAIPEKQRPEIARKFYEYWKGLQADDWNPCSNLLQDTELDEFKLAGTRLDAIEKLYLVNRIIQEGKTVYWYDNTNDEQEYRGLVKLIELTGNGFNVDAVAINGQEIEVDKLNKIYWECD